MSNIQHPVAYLTIPVPLGVYRHPLNPDVSSDEIDRTLDLCDSCHREIDDDEGMELLPVGALYCSWECIAEGAASVAKECDSVEEVADQERRGWVWVWPEDDNYPAGKAQP